MRTRMFHPLAQTKLNRIVEMKKNTYLEKIPEHSGEGDKGGERDGETGVATKVRPKTKRPSLYRVLLLNDDFTTQEFVVRILMDVFQKSGDDATRIMRHVHLNGVGECGIYPFEVAETKVMLVMDAARKEQHPLQCVMEKK